MTRRLTGVFLASILVATVTGAAPALAHNSTNGSTYDGPNCDWRGENGYSNVNFSAVGYTKLINGDCTAIQTKVRWFDGAVWITSTLTKDPAVNGNSHTLTKFGAIHLNYTDHNVKRNGVWLGWRLWH